MPKLLSILAIVVALAAFLLGWPQAGHSAAPAQQAEAKLSESVLRQTEAGAEVEFLVILQAQADLSHAATLGTKAEKGRYVYETLVATAQGTQKPLRDWLAGRGVAAQPFYIVNMLLVRGNRELALELAARPEVARIAANPSGRADIPEMLPAPDDANTVQSPAEVEPSIAYVNADDVWALGYRGQGIVIGGADTGYAWQHPALKPHYRGWDAATGMADHDYNWHDSIDQNQHGPNRCGTGSVQPCDDGTHGSHTMGTAVGWDGGTNQIGVAPDAKWIGCRNMDNGNGTVASYSECFEFFLAPYPVGGDPMTEGRPDLAPDVTNNSWSCTRPPPLEQEDCDMPDELQAVVEAQRAAGIFTVVAAGNSGSACGTILFPPAIYDAAYTVGNLDMSTGQLAGGSSRGPVTRDGSNRVKPDLAAPGTGIRSSVSNDGYGLQDSYSFSGGTSMAAPHVAGAVALILSARPDMRGNIEAIEGFLNRNAFPLETSSCGSTGIPNNWYGHGRLDALAAVEAALEAPTLIYLTNIQANAPLSSSQTVAGAATLLVATAGLALVGSRQRRQKVQSGPK